jgi:sugar phosphate isomerase/epimerase
MCLNPGAIGVQGVDQFGLLELARKHNFEAMIAMGGELADMSDESLSKLSQSMHENNITWGAAGLPLDFRGDEDSFRTGLAGLPRICTGLKRAGVTRMNTWIMPTHGSRTYRENFALHSDRLGQIAGILEQYNIRLGLEYVGPKTLMVREKYSFIRTMAETKELIASIGKPNVGFVLDSFHWFCAGESKADILSLNNEDIITCDLNDATAGRTADEQIDGQRQLPLASGVIPLKEFLSALVEIGYDGPVRAEPFNALPIKTVYGI